MVFSLHFPFNIHIVAGKLSTTFIRTTTFIKVRPFPFLSDLKATE